MALNPFLAAVKRNLPRVARSMGFNARVTSGYRSRARQLWLYNRWLRGLQQYPVAPPGTSDHERGLALDVVSTDPQKLVALLTAAGLSWAGPSDPVHFSLKVHPKSNQSEIQKKPGLTKGSKVLFGLFTLSREPTAVERAILNVENFLTFGLGGF